MLSAGPSGRQTVALVTLLLADPAQAPVPRYTVPILECAAFREEVRTDIRSESGGVLRQETAGRDGVLLMVATGSDSGMVLTAWYDSLAVWRKGPEGTSTPDTEGLLGGRWRGILTAEGSYTNAQTPFIPDDVAQIADLRGVLADFLPSLAPGVLVAGSGQNAGYAWSIKARSDTAGAINDTLEVPMRRQSTEEGTLAWDSRLGPVRWERVISVTGDISAKGPIRRAIRSLVTQRIRVSRLPGRACE
jgi:hypothetical protein